jgi:signal recognition particle subunit SRP19
MSGGGVSDNFFKDMMEEMGGKLPPGMEGMMNAAGAGAGAGGGEGGGKPKKIKRKIIRA